MAIELLPLLQEHDSPPIPGGEYVSPVASTSQEVANTVADYLDFLNPDLVLSSLPKMVWNEVQELGVLLNGPDSNIPLALQRLSWLIPLLPPVVGATVVSAAATIETLFNSAPVGEERTIFDKVGAIEAAVGTGSWWGTVPFDPTDPEWVLVGTDTFTDATHFAEEAHVYIIDAIAPFAFRSSEIIDGETVYFGLGWWAEMAGDYRGQRGYIDFAKTLAHRDGHLMRGCMVNFPKGGDGQISAYKYTPA